MCPDRGRPPPGRATTSSRSSRALRPGARRSPGRSHRPAARWSSTWKVPPQPSQIRRPASPGDQCAVPGTSRWRATPHPAARADSSASSARACVSVRGKPSSSAPFASVRLLEAIDDHLDHQVVRDQVAPIHVRRGRSLPERRTTRAVLAQQIARRDVRDTERLTARNAPACPCQRPEPRSAASRKSTCPHTSLHIAQDPPAQSLAARQHIALETTETVTGAPALTRTACRHCHATSAASHRRPRLRPPQTSQSAEPGYAAHSVPGPGSLRRPITEPVS